MLDRALNKTLEGTADTYDFYWEGKVDKTDIIKAEGYNQSILEVH